MKHGKFVLPKDHKPFMKVAKGGSNCSNCKFLTSDKKHCGNKYFVKWYGTDLLPTPVSRYCSDWYEPNPEYLKAGGIITPDLSGKPIEPINSERLAKKREHAEKLANSIRSLRSALTKDMKSDDEKTRLTALVIAIIDKTAERVGNEESEGAGHFGVTGFRKAHIKISGNTIALNYKGKSGVIHEKSFSDALIASTLAKAIKDTPKRSIFVTSDGFRIKANRVNRYLSEYNISAKDLRGYHANKYIIDKLHKQEIPTEIKDRKVVFKKAVRYSAARVGHAPVTLQKHYLFPELQVEYVNYGKIINLSDFYSGGGNVDVREDSGIIKGPSHDNGGIPMVVKPGDIPIEVEGKEYYLCKSALSDPHIYEFHDATNREVLDAIFQMEGCKYDPKVAHSSDFIVCKLATQDKTIRDRVGTISSILDSMQAEYGCKLTNNEEFTTGGPVGLSSVDNEDTFVDENGRERFEIDDLNVSLDTHLLQSLIDGSVEHDVQINIPCEEILTSWDGYKYYADLRKINVRFLNYFPYQNSFMAFDNKTNEIFVNSHKFYNLYHGYETLISDPRSKADRLEPSSYLLRRTFHGKLIHELQHAIQRIDGIEITVSNPDYILSILKLKYDKVDMSDADFIKWISYGKVITYRDIEYDFYKNIPSEKEALDAEQKIINYYRSNPEFDCGGPVIDSNKDINYIYSDKPISMEQIRHIPDYKLEFKNYVIKHSITETKLSFAEKQWIRSIKKANEEGLYDVAILNGSMDAITVQDMLTAAGLHVSDDIKKLVRQEHEELKAMHNSLKAETVIKAKEIKKVYTKQELIDTIAGLRVLAEDKAGKEKQALIDTIEGLEVLVETMGDTVEIDGYALYKDGTIIHESYT